MSSRSDVPFFHDPDTHLAIEEIARSNSLVIFAGSGATIDKTGLDWRLLLEALLGKAALPPPLLQSILQTSANRSHLHLASVVRSIYAQKGDDWRRHTSEALRSLLYQERSWRGGRYVEAIAELATAMLMQEKSVMIVTTNYDRFIEMAFDRVAAARGLEGAHARAYVVEVREPKTSPLVVRAKDLRERANSMQLQVLHVHGVTTSELRPDRKVGSVVIGETDYFLYERKVAELVDKFFRRSNVLILGSGFEDPSLLRSLANTKRSAEENGLRRWQISTRDAFAHDVPPDGNKAAEDLHRRRLREFGVEGVFPDFYSQVHQVVREVAQEIVHCSTTRTYSSTDADYRYGKRLTRWWASWYGGISSESGTGSGTAQTNRFRAQQRHHEQLASAVAAIRKTLGSNSRENIKIEVWVRWEPSDKSRKLRLWASSLGPWISEGAFKDEEISGESILAAMRAFCSGGAELVPGGKRWSEYLAVPVELADERGQSIVTGAISVATDSPRSNMRWEEVERMKRLTVQLPKIGAEILSSGEFVAVRP